MINVMNKVITISLHIQINLNICRSQFPGQYLFCVRQNHYLYTILAIYGYSKIYIILCHPDNDGRLHGRTACRAAIGA